ncbi:MAG: ABC transporter substrate-binding protein [Chloroflexota bacterium]|nr:ABC transporter substrate-binding protein [Chloroflexota bacterium]
MKTLAPGAILVILILCIACMILCTACAEPTVQPTPVPSPTPSPTPEPKILTVCLPDEPDSLYLYGSHSLAAQHIWQAIYDGPLDSRAYAHQPVILTGLPSLANGSAVVETVTVQAGDRVLAAGGEVVELAPGVTVEDAGGQRVTFDGDPIPMERMVVTFTLRPNLRWADGAPLTAGDSVFSFELAADPATPTDKQIIARTAGYRAAGARTVVWSGVPGLLDHFYHLNFWHPLPRHAWGGVPAADLLNAEGATRRPLGWGAFVIREWVRGDHLTAMRNPFYFRAAEGLPHLDEITFRFIPDPTKLAQELLAGRCDVVTHDATDAVLAALPNQPPVETFAVPDSGWELLAFGISPARGYDRPDFFEDVRVRQAIARCIDRQALAERVLHGYLPPGHPLYAGDALTAWEHDPPAGQSLLANAGWYDEDGDSVREAHNIPGIADGTPFQVSYHTTDDPLRVQTAHLVRENLAECGIRVSVETMPPETLFAPGPEGALFGRRFDLTQFSWRIVPDPLCDLFLSSQIPDAGRWDRPNVAGFLDDEYDTACLAALAAFPGSAEYAAAHAEAQRIFSERLPALPLFQRQKITLARAVVVGLSPDSTQPSELWNIEQLDLRP